jgi:hypothetical protein
MDPADALLHVAALLLDLHAQVTAYESRRFSPGRTASSRPSPANVDPSSTVNEPPSSVGPLELVSHTLRSGRAPPLRSFQTDTRSTPTSARRIGTSAD